MSGPVAERHGDPRDGESLDIEALQAWLAQAMPDAMPARTTLTVRRFPGGFSNLTYRLTLDGEHGPRALVLRRPPPGVPPGSAHDMAREYRMLAVLHPLGVPLPRPVALCEEAHVLGAPFYVMEHVEGLILRGTPPAAFTDGTEPPARLAALSRTFVETLAHLHTVPVAGTSLAALGRPEGYVQRQVHGWTARWHAARIAEVPALDRVAAWLDAGRPPQNGVALIHNDFKLDNLVLTPDGTHVRAILDWEMATIGDPLMDLGTSLAYWVEPDDPPIFRAMGLGVTALPGAYTRAELVAAYAEARGIPVPDVTFHHAFGLFKVAVIAQQIHARYVRGLTRDERFARLGDVVTALGQQAARVITTSSPFVPAARGTPAQ